MKLQFRRGNLMTGVWIYGIARRDGNRALLTVHRRSEPKDRSFYVRYHRTGGLSVWGRRWSIHWTTVGSNRRRERELADQNYDPYGLGKQLV